MGAFIRRAVASPGWHRHFKASDIVLSSAECKWNTVNPQCEKPNSGASGTVTNRAHPKEVYDWYVSTAGDTAKRKIPMRVWVAVGAAVAALGMLFGAYWWFNRTIANPKVPGQPAAGSAPAPAASAPAPSRGNAKPEEKRVLTAAEYGASFVPRVEGLAFTAPRYAGLNDPKTMPKPAACIEGKKPGAAVVTCQCWSQQATVLQMPEYLCKQIAAGGYFDDTVEAPQSSKGMPNPAPAPVPVQAQGGATVAALDSGLLLPPPNTVSTVERDAEVLQFMRKRSYIK
jgi:zona occludens toxin